jgi:hypothetical protein
MVRSSRLSALAMTFEGAWNNAIQMAVPKQGIGVPMKQSNMTRQEYQAARNCASIIEKAIAMRQIRRPGATPEKALSTNLIPPVPGRALST